MGPELSTHLITDAPIDGTCLPETAYEPTFSPMMGAEAFGSPTLAVPSRAWSHPWTRGSQYLMKKVGLWLRRSREMN